MQVLKFGGTSVGKPERMKDVARLIDNDQDKIVVLSALSGTTNNLVQIASAYQRGDRPGVRKLIDALEQEYGVFVDQLLKDQVQKQKATRLLSETFTLLRSFEGKTYSEEMEKEILAQGELLSTHLFHLYCSEIGIATQLIPALDFMRTVDGEPDAAFIRRRLKEVLSDVPDSKIYITQGYICRNENGQIDNLKRGGSDYTASLIGAALQASEIQIWTDIDGMHNNDPRIVKNTYPIEHLSFAEAAELAYFGAKILHPSSVLPAQRANIPVKLLNTMQPEAPGTVISSRDTPTVNKVKAVAAKDGIIAIKIRSSRMLLAYGFLKMIFEVFEKYKTPIDMITTSEVAVSLTIDNDRYLNEIIRELQPYGQIVVDPDHTIVCVVGEFKHNDRGIAVKVLESLKEIPIRMISSGGSESNISVLIPGSYKEKALKDLNENLFKVPLERAK